MGMFSRRSHCFLFAGFLLLFGCANPRTASTSTFKTAIQAALREDPLFLIAPIPVEFADSHGTHYTDDRLEALVHVGVLDKSSVMVKESPFSRMLEDRKRRVLPGVRYDVSDKGKQFLRSIKRLTVSTKVIAYADKQVVDIVRYSEPATSAAGQTVSEVTYTYKLVNIAEWARNPAVQKYFFTNRNNQLDENAPPIEAKAFLALMSDGWRVPRM